MAPSAGNRTATVWHSALVLVCASALGSGCDASAGPQDHSSRAAAGAAGEGTPADTATESASADVAAPPRTRDKTFDDIKFDIEKGESFERSMLSDQVKQLFGQPIRIRGYIFPTFRSKGIKQFVLVRDNQECCFGPGAALYDCIRVTLQEGTSIEYTRSPVAVEGVFKLDEQFIDPERTVGAVFHLDGAVVN